MSSISNISASQQARLEADALCIEPERTGSKKTAYNEKWGVKVLKGVRLMVKECVANKCQY